jgi:hypothetical protein
MADLLNIDYAHTPPRKGWSRFAKPMAITACSVGAAATLFPLWPLWGFYNIPVGTPMRPMALTFLLLVFAACGLFVSYHFKCHHRLSNQMPPRPIYLILRVLFKFTPSL